MPTLVPGEGGVASTLGYAGRCDCDCDCVVETSLRRLANRLLSACLLLPMPGPMLPRVMAQNSKARRGGADAGTIEDTRLYSVWDDGASGDWTGLGRWGWARRQGTAMTSVVVARSVAPIPSSTRYPWLHCPPPMVGSGA